MRIAVSKETRDISVIVTDNKDTNVSVCVTQDTQKCAQLSYMREEEMFKLIMGIAELFTQVCMKRVGDKRVWKMSR